MFFRFARHFHLKLFGRYYIETIGGVDLLIIFVGSFKQARVYPIRLILPSLLVALSGLSETHLRVDPEA